MQEPLHTKYRPKIFEGVVGQDAVVKSLQELLKKDNLPHSFLFTGNSGTGKTTFARILASELKCDLQNVIELDAATYTGIDSAREIAETLKYTPITGNPVKFVIIDEAHRISSAAWASWLKIVEETPSHVFFAFCTTELAKVPETIQTRCHSYKLRDVKYDDLMDLLEYVRGEENLVCVAGSLEAIAKSSNGSPRQALVFLSQIRGCSTIEEVRTILQNPEDSVEAIDLCRLIIGKQSKTWKEVMSLVKKIDESGKDAESLRIMLMNYFKVCAMNGKNDGEIIKALQLMSVFTTPVNKSTGFSEIILGLGQIFFEKA